MPHLAVPRGSAHVAAIIAVAALALAGCVRFSSSSSDAATPDGFARDGRRAEATSGRDVAAESPGPAGDARTLDRGRDAPRDAPPKTVDRGVERGPDLRVDRGPDGPAPQCTSAAQCDDKLSCTIDTCVLGTCATKLASGACLIDGTCRTPGATPLGDPCRRCDPTVAPHAWTTLHPCVITVAGDGKAGFLGGPALQAQFNNTYSVAVNGAGTKVYVADELNHAVRVVTGGQVSTLAGTGVAGWVDGAAATARFNTPRGLVLADDQLYVADSENHRLRVINLLTLQVSTLAGDGTIGYADGPALTGRLSRPRGLAVDNAGGVYVGDTGNHRVRRVAAGQLSTVAGTGVSGYLDGPASTAQLNAPRGVLLAGASQLYVADSDNNRIRLIDLTGKTVTTFAGAGVAGFLDGPLASARFNGPRWLALSASGGLYVADNANHRVRVIGGGQVTTLAGDGNVGWVDGPAAAARFNTPHGVAVDLLGRVYVADQLNNRVRAILP